MSETSTALDKITPGHGLLDFDQAKRYAVVVANSGLVPKPLEGKPDAVMLVGLLGQELGVPFIAALSEVHVIENRPSPSAQLRLSLIRKRGHEARFTESTTERAEIVGRRRENKGDPNGWVKVAWTIEDARRAGLVARWVERWVSKEGTDGRRRNVKETEVVGDDTGIFDAAERRTRGLPLELPEWAQKALDAGELHQKDNWQKYPAEMLRARAASALCRSEFSDVMLGMDIDEFSPEERGVDLAVDLEPEDRPTADDDAPPGTEDATLVDDEDEELVDAAWVKGYGSVFEDCNLTDDQAEELIHTATRGRVRELAAVRLSEVGELRRWLRAVNQGDYIFIETRDGLAIGPRSPEGEGSPTGEVGAVEGSGSLRGSGEPDPEARLPLDAEDPAA